MSTMSFRADGRSLVEFWNWAGRTGRMKPSTAGVYKTACKAVLSSLGAQWESYDLTGLDIEAVIRNFRRANTSRYDTRTLEKYSSNFRKAVPSLMHFLDDAKSWEAPAQPRQRHGTTKGSSPTLTPKPRIEPQVEEKPAGVESFCIGVSNERTVRITLPSDLTPDDAGFLIKVLPYYLERYTKAG
ncbi:hypothetical protein [Streptomyces abikoensis]|uniref:hypothetical protein n=1 Tax=Streptomyces abikoensis TaxID=97398 RepID=UPI0033E1F17B